MEIAASVVGAWPGSSISKTISIYSGENKSKSFKVMAYLIPYAFHTIIQNNTIDMAKTFIRK